MNKVLILVEGQTEEAFVRDVLYKHLSQFNVYCIPKLATTKRIAKLFPGYRKTLHGPLLTKRIGLKPIRKQCSHFDSWLLKLEELGK